MGNPMKIRAILKNGLTEVRVLVSHAMETGLRKGDDGAIVPAWFITELTAHYHDRLIFQAEFGTAVSKDPYLVFRFRGGDTGEKVVLRWRDSRGDTRSDEAAIS
jgi:sulfur-oxidizing protein SoxZ